MITDAVVKAMTQCIVERFAPERIIAFGSWARGEHDTDSDIDFLVVMPYKGSKRENQVAIRRALKDFTVPKDIIVTDSEELSQKQKINGLIFRAAVSEGVVLYER